MFTGLEGNVKYRRLGRTGLEVSEIVFGAGWVGGVLIHHDADIGREALRRARAAGINWIDTAPSYGDGVSEHALGTLLPELEWDPYISTKFHVDPASELPVNEQIERSVAASLARLGRTSVDLLQLHNPVGADSGSRHLAVDRVLEPGGVADALDDLKHRGVTRHVGFTANGDAASLERMVASGRFDTAQVYYNMLNPSAGRVVPAGWSAMDFGDVLARCAEHDVGVFVIRVMAAGVLATATRTGREIPMYESADMASEEIRARAVWAAIEDEPGSRAQAAIRFVLGDPRVGGVLVGPHLPEHVSEAVAAVDMAPFAPDTEAALVRLYANDFGSLS